MSADDKRQATRADSFGGGRDGRNGIGSVAVTNSATKSSDVASPGIDSSELGVKGVNSTNPPNSNNKIAFHPTQGDH